MSPKKISTNKTVASRSSESDTKKPLADLMDFEDFVADKKRPSGRGRIWLFFILIVVVLILAAAVYYFYKINPVESNLRYQAVTMDGGQVYYAKIVKEDERYIYLDDVFYINFQEQTIPAEEEGAEPQVFNLPILVHRGDEFYKPEGYLRLNRDKVLATEVIGEDSEVYQEMTRLKAEEAK